jgi:hypothetical protein
MVEPLRLRENGGLVDELEKFVAGRRLKLLEVDHAVIVRVGFVKFLLDESHVLFLVQRAVIVRIGGLERASSRRPASSLASSVPSLSRLIFLKTLEGPGLG